MRDDTDDSDSTRIPWDSPRDVRTQASFRNWGHRSHRQGIGMIISVIVLSVAISGYTGGAYGMLAFGALVVLAVGIFVLSFPYQIFAPTDEAAE